VQLLPEVKVFGGSPLIL